MKKATILSLVYFLIFQNLCSLDESDKIAYGVFSKAADSLENEHNMKCIGVKLGGPEKIKIMGLHFQKFKKLSKEECRKIIISSTTTFLTYINHDKRLSNHLENFPATIHDIEMVIFISNDDQSELIYPDIGWVKLINGKLKYFTLDPINTFKIKTTETESFQEALDILSCSEKSNKCL